MNAFIAVMNAHQNVLSPVVNVLIGLITVMNARITVMNALITAMNARITAMNAGIAARRRLRLASKRSLAACRARQFSRGKRGSYGHRMEKTPRRPARGPSNQTVSIRTGGAIGAMVSGLKVETKSPDPR